MRCNPSKRNPSKYGPINHRQAFAGLLGLFCWPLLAQTSPRPAPSAETPIVTGGTLHLPPGRPLAAALAGALAAPFPDSYDVEADPASARVKKTVHTCAEYLALPQGKLSTGSSLDDRTLASLGADCVALDWIRGALATAHPSPHPLTFRQVTVRQLPPELALALSVDDRKAASEASRAGQSILALEPAASLRAKAADRASLVCPDWTEALALQARGDLQGNGEEQWVVRAAAQATGGTYSSTRLFLLTWKGNKFTVVRSYPPVPEPAH